MKASLWKATTAVATLGISFAQRPDMLLKQGNGMFVTEGGENLAAANGMAGVTYSMQQGYLEGSNVDAARTMTDMLTATVHSRPIKKFFKPMTEAWKKR